MSIHSIRVKNVLSFSDVHIQEIKDINCIIGKNNVGKSNLLKVIRYFYAKLEESKEIPLGLNSKYNNFGTITIRYDTTRIEKIVKGKNNRSPFLRHIYNTLFKENATGKFVFGRKSVTESYFDLTLYIFKDDSVKWSIEDRETRSLIKILYPFFDVETRHIDLYDWDRVWNLISQLSSFSVKKMSNEDVVNYLDSKISNGSGAYKDYIEKVESIIDTKNYSYKDKVLSYIKVGLKGHDFLNVGENLKLQSDGTNSHKFLEILLTLLIVLTRKEYISPIIYIDEPEVGLHPKLNEVLISTLHEIYKKYESTEDFIVKGKYKTPYPKIIISTHSPHILKHSIKLFRDKQQVIHLSKNKQQQTVVNKLNSQYNDTRFLNVFSDNEARLFFSDFIFFVEGATEMELFSNYNLCRHFKFLSKIDIYETNDLTLKYLNPSYSKAAIPFQILYDSDVFIEIDHEKQAITYNNGKIKTNKYKNELKLKFFKKIDREKKELLNQVLSFPSKKLLLSENKVLIENLNIDKVVSSINKLINSDNITLTYTTIEGTLINETSIHLFERWICSQFFNNCKYNDTNAKPDRFLLSLEKKYLSNNKTSTEIVNSLLTIEGGGEVTLSKSNNEFISKMKLNHLKRCKRKINSMLKSKRDRVNIYRLVFEGKTDTLLSRTNERYTTVIDNKIIALVKEIRMIDLKCIAPVMGKTGGWVTDFLDYSIEEIEKSCNKNDKFERKFTFIFPELSSILTKVSSSIA